MKLNKILTVLLIIAFSTVFGQTKSYAKNYFENGKIESENPFVNDERDGLTTDYYENGKVAKTLNIIDGVTQGESPVYDELGEIIYVRKYENDVLVGYTYNDSKGQLLPFKKIDVGETKINCFFKINPLALP